MCGRRDHHEDQQDQDEDQVGSQRDFLRHLLHRPVVPPSANPVPTEYGNIVSITLISQQYHKESFIIK